jgi:hypothetical protein
MSIGLVLVGPRRWHPRMNLGTFPVRFPSPDDPGDAGWHIDVSFATDPNDFLAWRANVTSKGRALLLFLFSDVGRMMRRPAFAPDRISTSPGGSRRRVRGARHCESWPRMILRRPRGGRRCWRRERRARSTSAIRFSCMPPNRIAGHGRALWRSHRCSQPNRSCCSGRTARIRRSNMPSAALCGILPNRK